MSYVEIRCNEDRQEYELLLKVFTDDLEKALSTHHSMDIEIYTDREHPKADSLILSYLNKTIKAEKGKTDIPLTYLGREYKPKEFFMTYLYFTFPKDRILTNLSLTSTLFTEIYDNQINIVTYINKGEISKYTLTKYDKKVELLN